MRYIGILIIAASIAGIIYFGTVVLSELSYAPQLFFLSITGMIPGLYLVYEDQRRKNQNRLRKYREPINKFKKKAKKKVIPLDDCELIPKKEFNGDSISMDYHLQFYNSLYSKEYFINETPEDEYVIFYQKDNYRFYSTPIPLDPEEISEEMRVKKYTDLYYNRENPREYYFDIEFLAVEL